MPAHLLHRLLPALALLFSLAGPATARPAADEAVTVDRPAEYMIYQYPDTTLVLKIDVAEAEFAVRTFGPENALLRSSGVPGRRIGPVFQQIDASSLARQLMIEVTPRRPVPRSAIRLEVLQFAAGDRNAASQLRAYQLVSVGAETERASDASTWASKAYSLRNAAGLFASLGMEEMRLWSEYLAAHLVLHRLADPLMALELVGAVQAGASRAGYAQTELAARALEAEAVLQLAAGSGARSAALYHARAHEVLAHVAELARQLGLAAEHGRALYQDGRVFELQGEPERALEQYQAAVAITKTSGDTELLNEIRATAAALYETEGRASGAIAMLDDIATDLTAEQQNADLDRALRLFEKGRLLNNTYRYEEAVAELSQALALQQPNTEPRLWGPTSLELAWAHYSLGATAEALALLEAALPAVPVRGNEAALVRAYGSLAGMHRQWREFEQAARARDQQGDLLGAGPGRAAWLVEAALDAAARDGMGSIRAQGLAREARQAAAREDDRPGEQRATLLLCLLQLEAGPAAACDQRGAESAYAALGESGIPWMAADAALLHARIQSRSGQAGAARLRMERLIDELAWYRRALPGVLGAWYVQSRTALTREYLALTRSGGATGSGPAADLMLAMERVQQLEASDYARPEDRPLDAADAEALRALLWTRAEATGERAVQLAAEINQRLASAKAGPGAALAAPDLERLLGQLTRSEAVLTFYLDGRLSQALIARRGRVQAVDLPGGARLLAQVEALRDTLAGPAPASLTSQLDALGQSLLGPVSGLLPARVYLLPSGPLRAVPIDALRLDGRYFAEDHEVVNLVSLGSIPRRAPVLPAGFRERVFVAGNPQEQGDPFNLEFRLSPEIAAVTDQFVGPGLHIVQGVALRKDEFQDERFTGAALVHLALAGTLNLDLPDRSRLLLAPPVDRGVELRSFLAPGDVRGFDLAASLVVLSGTVVAGQGQSPLDRRLAFVADFLEAGSAAVLVSLWPTGERVNADFAAALYHGLLEQPDIASVLAATKRAQIAADRRTNLPTWAGFQLFIR